MHQVVFPPAGRVDSADPILERLPAESTAKLVQGPGTEEGRFGSPVIRSLEKAFQANEIFHSPPQGKRPIELLAKEWGSSATHQRSVLRIWQSSASKGHR